MAMIETHLEEATQLIRRERRRSVDERQAFRAFRSAVADVRPTATAGKTGGPLTTKSLTYGSASPSLDTIRREYERTVMAIPHYEDEYGDTYTESVTAEFGEDVAAAITRGSTLTPNLRQAVVAGATAAMEERTEFVSLLDTESDSVEAVRTTVHSAVETLRALDDEPLSKRSFENLTRLRESVVSVRDRLDEAAVRRQTTLRSHRRNLSNRVPDVTMYLYEPLAVEYPALNALASAREIVEAALRRLDRQLIAAL
ncbi:DUF7260 family protein [Halogeometricum borinquense]|nr:hypothetical protein [Halogeometricum borinquense]